MDISKLRRSRQPRLMIIPMIDIIFFLLVFFMMSTLYMVDQHLIPVNLPEAMSSKQEKPHSIAVTVTADGHTLFDQDVVAAESLPMLVQRERQNDPTIVFLLRADKTVEYGRVIAVLDELKAGGAQHISVATERKGN